MSPEFCWPHALRVLLPQACRGRVFDNPLVEDQEGGPVEFDCDDTAPCTVGLCEDETSGCDH